jgi:hypothetical protein
MRKLGLVLFLLPAITACSRNESAPRTEELQQEGVEFLADKIGDSESKLQRSLEPVLRAHKNIQKAYLVLVRYPGIKEPSVALCLKSASGDDPMVVSEASKVLASILNNQAALDIIFVDEANEPEILKVAKPFYTGT